MSQAPSSSWFSWLRRLYDWVLGKSTHPQAEYWLAGISFMESSFFPIPPHPLLGLMCLSQPQRAVRYGIICTVASVLGGLFGYALGYFLYESVGSVIVSVLGLETSFPRAACHLRNYGVEIILIKGATPIPFKLLTLSAGFIQMNLWSFLWASTLSRGFQFLLIGVLFHLFGPSVKVFIEKYLALLTGVFLLLLVGGFFLVGVIDIPVTGDVTEDGVQICTDADRASLAPPLDAEIL